MISLRKPLNLSHIFSSDHAGGEEQALFAVQAFPSFIDFEALAQTE